MNAVVNDPVQTVELEPVIQETESESRRERVLAVAAIGAMSLVAFATLVGLYIKLTHLF